MEHQLCDVKRVVETYNPEEVNGLLDEGWVIHSMFPSPNKTIYILVKF